jgi:PKD repeat protein
MHRFSLTLACLLAAASQAHAFGPYGTTWSETYPNSQSDENVVNGTGSSCALCHSTNTGGGQFNAYGWEIRKGTQAALPILEAIKAAETLDSDADPSKSTNKAEIDGNFQPGWAAGSVNILYNKDGTTVTGQPAFVGIPSLDPVVNAPPVASAAGPYTGTVGAPITFDGSGSKDDGTIVTYAWAFGDGMTGTGPKPTHAYAAAGTYAVTLTVTDDMAATGTATTSAVVVVGNAAPVAVADSYSTPVNTPLQIAAPGVLANDTDGNMDALTAKMVTAPIYGTLALMTDGSFLYTPNANYTGPDSFTYAANDGKADSAPATVSLNVMAPVVLDIDISAFRASKRARVGGKKAISLKLVAKGVAGDGTPKPATLVGTQNGAEVYKETVMVSAAAGERASVAFPSYSPQAGGEITWELTVMDDDTDVDTASASTLAVE